MRLFSIAVLVGLMLGACSGAELGDGVTGGALDGAGVSDAAGDIAAGDIAAGDVAAGDVAAQTDASLDTSPAEDAGATADGSGDAGKVSIYLTGDTKAVTFTDGLAGQTPTKFEIALSRYHILTSPADPAPVLCFDHGPKPVVADLAKDTLVGSCPTAGLPTAMYSHGRVKVDWARFTVQGKLHAAGGVYPHSVTFFRAWSDTTVDGEAYKAGQGTITVVNPLGVQVATMPYTYPPAPPIAGMTTETVKGEYLMTFVWSKPLPVVKDFPGEHWSRFHWHVFQGFRWQDSDVAAHVKDAWDVWATGSDTEAVKVAGVTGYHVTSSAD